MLNILPSILLLLIGSLDGVIDGVTGASGGMLNVPILIFIGVPIKAAIGTSLAVDVVGDCVVTYTYNKYRNVEGKIAVPLMLGTVIGAQIGSAFGTALPNVGLESLYGFALIISGVFFWRSKGKIAMLAGYKKLNARSIKTHVVVSSLIGLGVGTFIVIFGGGGGMMILFILLFVFGFPMHKAVGTSIMVEIGSSLSGCLGYAIRGHINVVYGIILMIGITVGGRLAAKAANKINEETLSKFLGGIKIILGLTMIFLM